MAKIWQSRMMVGFLAIILISSFAMRYLSDFVALGVIICSVIVAALQLTKNKDYLIFYFCFLIILTAFFIFIYFVSPHGELLDRDMMYFLNVILSVAFLVPFLKLSEGIISHQQRNFLYICLIAGIVITLITSSIIRPHLTAYHGVVFLIAASFFVDIPVWRWVFISLYAAMSFFFGQSQNLLLLVVWPSFFLMTLFLPARAINRLAIAGIVILPVVVSLLFSAGSFRQADFDTKVRAYFSYTILQKVFDSPSEIRFGMPIIPFDMQMIGRSTFRGSVESIQDIGSHNFFTTVVAKMGLVGIPVAIIILFMSFYGFPENGGRVSSRNRIVYSYVVAFLFISLSVNEAVLSFLYAPVLLLPGLYAFIFFKSDLSPKSHPAGSRVL